MNEHFNRNKYCYGLGTIGRDMFYALEANALIYYLSNVLSLNVATFVAASLALTLLRICDALNDPITGLIIDNTRTRWGKYKPPMLIGALTSVVFFLLLFADLGLTGKKYVVVFALAYILWDITYGINDIAYWSMLPSLSLDQKDREKMGAFARICANIGMYIIMVGWQPITSALGNTPRAWFLVAASVSVLMIGFQLFTLLGVKERRETFKTEENTSLKELISVLFRNDQLLWTTIAMVLFMIGYCTTTGFATYYMQYLFGDIDMYAVLAAVCGEAQLAALVVFPLFSKHFSRRRLYTGSTVLVCVGYAVFFFAERSIFLVAIAAVLIFLGQAFIQLLMLMFLADTIEYGQWKLGRRNDSITFSVQPLINKIGGALSTGVISITLVLSGIKVGDVAADSINAQGQLIVKIAMLLIPVVFILLGYFIYRKKYRITPELYRQILSDLERRGDLQIHP